MASNAAMLQQQQQQQPQQQQAALRAHASLAQHSGGHDHHQAQHPPVSLADSIRSLRDPAARLPSNDVPATDDEQRRAAPARRKKAVPSPLTASPSAAAAAAYTDEPRSPREALEALLEEEHNHAGLHSNTTTPTAFSHSPRALHPPGHAPQLRHASSPSLPTNSSSSPAMPPPSRPFRPETKPTAPPRNLSIDSAASSATSSGAAAPRPPPGHSSRPSQDVNTTNPPDMAAVIAAAGSPEAALLAMWKEKQNQASHNQQLWRLVEKQRAMVIGLQKDLERALKDKDRYRRKMKEYAEQAPPVPGALARSDTFESVVGREHSESPAPGERPEEPVRPAEPAPVPHRVAPQAQPAAQMATQLYPESQLATSPAHSSVASPTASSTNSAVNSPTDYSVKPLALGSKALAWQQNTLDSQLAEKTPHPVTATQPDATTCPTPNGATQQPQLAVTQATPELRGGSFSSPPRKPAQPLRKAPPAPLNLSKPVTTSAHLHQATNEAEDDSDYDDTLEVDEIPVVTDRGRRKTREDDDRAREAAVLKDEEARSKSAKKKSESKGKPQSTPAET